MNIDELKAELDKIEYIKTIKYDDSLAASFRNLHVTKNFDCVNDCYVLVKYNGDFVEDVVTMPLMRDCPLWRSVDSEINQMIQGLL